jgi:predicted permease
VSVAHFQEWQRDTTAFDDIALVSPLGFTLAGTGTPEVIQSARVSWRIFDLLGVRPRLGRTFRQDEDQIGRDRVVVINDRLWQRRFNADAEIVGRMITLDGERYEVVGVLPPSFRFPKISHLYSMAMPSDLAGATEIWKPFGAVPAEMQPFGGFNNAAIGRLKPGVSIDQSVAQLNAVQAAISARIQGQPDLRAFVVPLQDQLVDRSRQGLQLTFAAVCLVLLIGCVNISNLLLSRSIGRRREVAIRSAVGATRGRLVRQMLVETVTMSALGGLLAVGLAYALVPILVRYAPQDLPRLDEVRVDLRLLGFTALLAGLAGLVVGVLPAWRFGRGASRSAPSTLTTRTSASASGRMRASLVGLEVAVTAVALIVGGLLLNSLVRLLAVDPGFSTDRVLTMELTIPVQRYRDLQARSRFVTSVVDVARRLPGVISAGASSGTPLTGTGMNNAVMTEGPIVPRPQRPRVDTRVITPDYLATTGTPLKSGRMFSDADRGRAIAVVSASAAARLVPSGNPVGRKFGIGPDAMPTWFETVGVVGDIRTAGLDAPAAMTVYLPASIGFLSTRVSLSVRTTADALATPAALTRALHEFDRELVVPPVKTMGDVVDASVAHRRFQLNLILLFAMLATVLAAFGIYGVVSQSVAQRTNEFGIRLALGARAGQIRALVLRQGALPVAAGLFVGIGLAGLSSRFLGSLLYEIKPTDSVTIGAVVGLLILVSLAAMHLPARRATRVDPMIALRAD